VQWSEEPGRHEVTTTRHQRHWSTASVIDLTDNYADVATAPPPRAAPAPAGVPPGAPRGLPGPAVTRSWDRRAPAAAGETVSAGVGRRPARYPVDYSSDTDAQFVDAQLPVEWRRPPQTTSHLPDATTTDLRQVPVASSLSAVTLINDSAYRSLSASKT